MPDAGDCSHATSSRASPRNGDHLILRDEGTGSCSGVFQLATRLDVVERDSFAGRKELVEPSAILGNIETCEIGKGIQQRDGIGEHCRDILPALGRDFGRPGVSRLVDLDRAADEVHRNKKGAVVLRSHA